MARETRKIIQITASNAMTCEDGYTEYEAMLFALCDDGTVWRLVEDNQSSMMNSQWRKLPNIPQGLQAPPHPTRLL